MASPFALCAIRYQGGVALSALSGANYSHRPDAPSSGSRALLHSHKGGHVRCASLEERGRGSCHADCGGQERRRAQEHRHRDGLAGLDAALATWPQRCESRLLLENARRIEKLRVHFVTDYAKIQRECCRYYLSVAQWRCLKSSYNSSQGRHSKRWKF